MTSFGNVGCKSNARLSQRSFLGLLIDYKEVAATERAGGVYRYTALQKMFINLPLERWVVDSFDPTTRVACVKLYSENGQYRILSVKFEGSNFK